MDCFMKQIRCGRGVRSNLCSKCKKEKELETKRYCRQCHNTYMTKWRKTHPLTPEQRFKLNVRSKTKMRIRRGLLIKQPCEVCHITEKVEAHHKDYNKPYDITWLCFKHHRELHRQT